MKATDTGIGHGPWPVPLSSFGSSDGWPTHPADYGRYLVIDLDANNWISRKAWAERNPGKELPSFGFGVCRHGFGLQELGYLTEEEAIAHAKRLNSETRIGEAA